MEGGEGESEREEGLLRSAVCRLCVLVLFFFFFGFFFSFSFPTSILSLPLEVLPYLNGISGDRSPLCKAQT